MKITMGTLNIQSIRNKYLMLEQLLHENQIDILCITETFKNTNCMSYNFLNHDFFDLPD